MPIKSQTTTYGSVGGNIQYTTTSTGKHIFYTGGVTERMKIESDGIIYINNNNVDNGSAKLLVGGSDGSGISAYFYHPNHTQGIGIVYHGLWGLSANQNIVMRPRGTGTFQVSGNTTTTGYISAGANISTSSYILTNNGFYDRSSYDTRSYRNSGGMYLQMGDIGTDSSPTYFKMGSYNGNTNFWSINNRHIVIRLYVGGLGIHSVCE